MGFERGLEIWKIGESGVVLGSFSARSLLINFFKSQPANIKKGIATRACGAVDCFSCVLAEIVPAVFHLGEYFRGRLSIWQGCLHVCFRQFWHEIEVYKGRCGVEIYEWY